MCGIVGEWNFRGESVAPEILVGMRDAIAHRGPDDAGLYLDGDLGLGHRRLSIIDLSAAGHQPMANAAGDLWLVFNGEIYNYIELREELRARGRRFATQTDTEVILHAYEEWGEGCLERFNGMWAFALWDARRRELFCARDRVGIKPFYYYADGRRLVFGSEIKALLAHPEVPRAADDATLYRLIRFGLQDTGEATCFAGVRQLLPGHRLRVAGGKLAIRRYWDPDVPPAPGPPRTNGEYAEQFRELLEQSVRLRLRSDVPVGACLSGGLDSSALVGLAAGMLPNPLRTFSVTYPGTADDEHHFVEELIGTTGNIESLVETPDGSDAFDVLRKSVWAFDEPTWGANVYSWWHVMRLVKSGGVTVILNGQGSDECLAGYPAYYPSFLRQLLLAGQFGQFRREARVQAAKLGVGMAGLLRYLALPYWPTGLRRLTGQVGHGASFNDDFLRPEFRRAAGATASAGDFGRFGRLRDHLLSDLTTTRLPALLHAEDRFSMAFALESRVPFVDYRVVEFCFGLPDDQKVRAGLTKVVLRNAMRGLLPASIVDRTDKKGYPTPAEGWLRTTARAEVADLLASRSFGEHGVFRADAVRGLFERFCRGEIRLRHLWRWLSVEIWQRTFLDQPPPAPAPHVLADAVGAAQSRGSNDVHGD